jgi:hypothetical protein
VPLQNFSDGTQEALERLIVQGWTPEDALRWFQEAARRRGGSIDEVAADVLDGRLAFPVDKPAE